MNLKTLLNCFNILVLGLFVSCMSRSEDSPQNTEPSSQRRRGYFAFTGSYSSSGYIPLLELVKRDPNFSDISSGNSLSALMGLSENARSVADIILKEKVESIFTTGDNNYSFGCQSTIDVNIGSLYSSYIGNYRGFYGTGALVNEFFPAMGNHDVLIYEAYLVRNGQSVPLNQSNDDPDDFRFSRSDWISEIKKSAIVGSDEEATAIFQYLLDQNKWDTKQADILNDAINAASKGTIYIPKEKITIDDFDETNETVIRTAVNSFMGFNAGDAVVNYWIHHILFNLYCNQDNLDDSNTISGYTTIPYFKYFTLPGNERYYKVSKEHLGVTVDFFILNVNTTFNSRTAHEPDGRIVGSNQYNWFLSQVNASSADFKIAIFHDEVYGSFESNPKIQAWNLEQYVDVVMSGDIQTYERIFISTDHGRATFLSVGVGGLNLERNDPTPIADSQKLVKEFGALFMEIRKGKLFFEFKNIAGEVKDSFSIIKADDGGNQ